MGEEAGEQRQHNESGKGFLSFTAPEEILQLVDLAISVHFSLCNQPICSSTHITSARPVAGRHLPGTVFTRARRSHSRRAQDKGCPELWVP